MTGDGTQVGAGLPVLVVRGVGGPGEVTASLVVGVGRRDETLATHKITDLVVALATADAGSGEVFAWGTVGMDRTAIRVSGDPDDVRATLERVVAALADLPLDLLEAERADLARPVTDGDGFDDGDLPPVEGDELPAILVELLRRRFGARGPGLVGFAAPLLDDVTADQVQAHASRWFVNGNAALVVSGGLDAAALADLALPAGDRPVHAPAAPLALPTPCFDLVDGDEVGLGMLVEDSPRGRAAVYALAAALSGRVREDGVVGFGLAVGLHPVGDGTLHAALSGELHGASASQVASVLWEEAGDLAAEGPEGDEEWQAMRRAVTRAALVEGDPLDAAEDAVASWLADPPGPGPGSAPDPNGAPAVLEDVSVDDVRDVIAKALPSMLVVLPGGIGPRVGLERLRPPVRPAAGGRTYKGRLFGAARGSSVEVTDQLLTLTTPETTVVLPWRQLAGAAVTAEGDLVLIGPDGGALHLDAGDWKDGADLVEAVLDRLPEGLLPDEG